MPWRPKCHDGLDRIERLLACCTIDLHRHRFFLLATVCVHVPLQQFANFESDDGESRPPVIFDKVIFMVVDALRRYGKATDCHHIFLVDTRYQ